MANPYYLSARNQQGWVGGMSLVSGGVTSPISESGRQTYFNPITGESSPIAFSNATEMAKAGYYIGDAMPTPFYGDVREGSYKGVKAPKIKTEDPKKQNGDNKPKDVDYSAKQIERFTAGTMYAMKAVSALTNGYCSMIQHNMKAANLDFAAKQSERNAALLMKNQRDITRAAQMDANVYKMQAKGIKSSQRIAMAESGFAVGKGVNKVVFDKTDAMTNYNVAAQILKAELQNAEATRQSGTYKAQAIIQRADAEAERVQGKIAKRQGITDAIMNTISAGANIYIGHYGLDDKNAGSK